MPSSSDTDVTIALDERHQHFGRRRPVFTDNSSPAAVCSTSATAPDVVDRRRSARQTLELVVVELVGVVDGRQVGGVDDEQGARAARRRRPGRDAVEAAPAAGRRARAPRRRRRSRLGSSRAPCRAARYPARTGRAGSSVRTSTTTSPRDAVRLDDPSDDEVHRPATLLLAELLVGVHHVDADAAAADAATRVRSAVAVRPPRPMTLPRSSGCTCTSTVRPRRLVTMSTRTSSGLSTIPRTRCSTASTTTVLIRWRRAALSRRGLGGSPRPSRPRRPSWRAPSSSWRGRRAGGRIVGGGQRGVEQVQLAGLGLLDLQGALGAGQALELLPVAGDLQQRQDRFGGLGADAEPVLRALRVDLDEARVFLRVVPADDLDGPAVAAVARVGDGDAVLGIADLAEAGELDLDSHGERLLLWLPRLQFKRHGRDAGSGFALRV